MTPFEKTALDCLVSDYRSALVTAGYANAMGCIRPDLVKNPWSYLPQWQADAIMAAVDAGIWPANVPLAERPGDA